MRLYTPPPGTFDLPFTWAFDASQLTDEQTYLNNLVYIKGGYGDFVMRRIVGLSRVLDPTTGKYQIRDGMLNNIEQVPIFGASADQNAVLPELIYPETGGIRFDLYNVLRPNPQPSTAQIAFQGVRRMKGQSIANPSYKATPKSFTYTMAVNISAPVGSVVTGRVPMDNYDFELHQLIILTAPADSVIDGIEGEGIVTFTNKPANPAPFNTVNLSIPDPTGIINQAFSLVVTGNSIVVNLATDAGGLPDVTTVAQLIAAFAANPAANNLLTLVQIEAGTVAPLAPVTIGVPGGLTALTSPLSSLWIYDRNRVQIANMPILDLYCDGGPGGVYQNGAIVTPLWYPKDSQIQIDFYSQLDGITTVASAGIIVLLVGKKWYPC